MFSFTCATFSSFFLASVYCQFSPLRSPLRGCTRTLGALQLQIKAEKPLSDTLVGNADLQIYDFKRKPPCEINVPLMLKGAPSGTIVLRIRTEDPEWELQLAAEADAQRRATEAAAAVERARVELERLNLQAQASAASAAAAARQQAEFEAAQAAAREQAAREAARLAAVEQERAAQAATRAEAARKAQVRPPGDILHHFLLMVNV